MSPKISVVIPSFNKVKFISQTLNSIVNQNYPNLEVIIQDGGSSDGTLDVIKKYAGKYPRVIKWESKKDNGQLDAVNKGMGKAVGEILTYINADDEYQRGAMETVADMYSKRPDGMWFVGRGIVIDENNYEITKAVTWYKSFLMGANRYWTLLVINYLMQPSVFLARDAYEKYGPFTGTKDFLMEYEMWLKLGKIQMPVVVNKVLSRFRIEPSTKTKRLFKSLLFEDRKIVEKYTKNPIILFLHGLHNLGRILVGRFV